TEARRHQHDARVPHVGGDGVMSEPEEVHDIPGDDRPAFARGVLELRPIVELDVADVVGAGRVYATPPKKQRDDRRQVLIEIELHRVKRTSPGYCCSTALGVSAALASIWA